MEDSHPHKHFMLLGDFNYHSMLTVNPGSDPAAREFYDKTMDAFLYLNVHDATRVRRGQNSSKLDYIFMEEDNLIEDLETLPPLGKK